MLLGSNWISSPMGSPSKLLLVSDGKVIAEVKRFRISRRSSSSFPCKPEPPQPPVPVDLNVPGAAAGGVARIVSTTPAQMLSEKRDAEWRRRGTDQGRLPF